MKPDPERNHQIAHAYLGGVPTASLAAHYGLTEMSMRFIVRNMRPLVELQDGRPIPRGMSLQAAIMIERAIGIWPFNEKAREIADRSWEIMRAPGKMRPVLEEVDAWLGSLGVTPGAKKKALPRASAASSEAMSRAVEEDRDH